MVESIFLSGSYWRCFIVGQAVFFVADAVFGAPSESGVRRLRYRGRAVFVKRDSFVAISFPKTSLAFFGCGCAIVVCISLFVVFPCV